MALDRRLSRVTIFDSSGAVGRIVQLPTRFVSVHPLAEGMWLAAEEEGFFGGMIRQDASIGLQRFPSVVAILDPTGSRVDTLGMFPGAEMAYMEAEGRIGAVPAAYGRVLTLGTRGDEIYVGIGNELGYEVYSSSRQHLRSVRAQGPDRTLSSTDVSALHEKVLAEISNQAVRDRFADNLRSAAVPERKAAYTRLLVDAQGNIWLSDYETPYVATGTWRVFDQSGSYLGEVHAPPRLRILEVGEDYVAGIWTADLGVESVRVYQLNR